MSIFNGATDPEDVDRDWWTTTATVEVTGPRLALMGLLANLNIGRRNAQRMAATSPDSASLQTIATVGEQFQQEFLDDVIPDDELPLDRLGKEYVWHEDELLDPIDVRVVEVDE